MRDKVAMFENEIRERLEKIQKAFNEGRLCRITYELLIERHKRWCMFEAASSKYKELNIA